MAGKNRKYLDSVINIDKGSLPFEIVVTPEGKPNRIINYVRSQDEGRQLRQPLSGRSIDADAKTDAKVDGLSNIMANIITGGMASSLQSGAENVKGGKLLEGIRDLSTPFTFGAGKVGTLANVLTSAYDLSSDSGIRKTLSLARSGQVANSIKSLAGDALDLVDLKPNVKGITRNGQNSINSLEYKPTLALPLLQQNSNTRRIRLTDSTPSNRVIKLGNKEYNDNYSFIKKFNKWNTHYGYEPLSYNLATDSKKLDDAIKSRLQEHNTWLRGAFVDKSHTEYLPFVKKLQEEGIPLTNANILENLAIRYLRDNAGYSMGRAGFGSIPAVKDWNTKIQRGRFTDDGFITDSGLFIPNMGGSIYGSNSLTTAAGYAKRRGENKYNGVFKIRRPLSFNGSREDWVKEADFGFASSARNTDKSKNFYELELPYLMQYGVSPNERIFDKEVYKRQLNNLFGNDDDGYKLILGIDRNSEYRYLKENEDAFKHLGLNIGDLNIKTGTHFDQYRNSAIRGLIQKYGLNTPENVEKIIKIANSKRFNDNVYTHYKREQEAKRRFAARNSFRSLTTDELNEKLIRDGVEALTNQNYIGTSEALRRASRNKGNPYQHIILAGKPNEIGMELVERIPYREWKDLDGNTSHYGRYTEGLGLSRKSRALGGNVKTKQYSLRNGGDIHIKPENRGKFTATMKRTGKTAEELSHSSNPLTRKRAIFALNARKWHH